MRTEVAGRLGSPGGNHRIETRLDFFDGGSRRFCFDKQSPRGRRIERSIKQVFESSQNRVEVGHGSVIPRRRSRSERVRLGPQLVFRFRIDEKNGRFRFTVSRAQPSQSLPRLAKGIGQFGGIILPGR